MNVGRFGEDGEFVDQFLDDPTPYERTTPVKLTDLQIEEYADFTENS